MRGSGALWLWEWEFTIIHSSCKIPGGNKSLLWSSTKYFYIKYFFHILKTLVIVNNLAFVVNYVKKINWETSLLHDRNPLFFSGCLYYISSMYMVIVKEKSWRPLSLYLQLWAFYFWDLGILWSSILRISASINGTQTCESPADLHNLLTLLHVTRCFNQSQCQKIAIAIAVAMAMAMAMAVAMVVAMVMAMAIARAGARASQSSISTISQPFLTRFTIRSLDLSGTRLDHWHMPWTKGTGLSMPAVTWGFGKVRMSVFSVVLVFLQHAHTREMHTRTPARRVCRYWLQLTWVGFARHTTKRLAVTSQLLYLRFCSQEDGGGG